jgi:hypothetical protein
MTAIPRCMDDQRMSGLYSEDPMRAITIGVAAVIEGVEISEFE